MDRDKDPKLLPEMVAQMGLTPMELRVLGIVQASVISGNFADGIESAVAVISSTGATVEMVPNGSNPNRGSLSRNWRYPQGLITVMNTAIDTPESVLRELTHEFLYLTLLKLVLPNSNDVHDPAKFEQATLNFIIGLGPRLLAEIDMAQTIADEGQRETYIRNRQRMMEKIQDPVLAQHIASNFITYH